MHAIQWSHCYEKWCGHWATHSLRPSLGLGVVCGAWAWRRTMTSEWCWEMGWYITGVQPATRGKLRLIQHVEDV